MLDRQSPTESTQVMVGSSEPDIIFLGLCERASYVREANTNLFKWNVLGLKHIVLSHIFPLPFVGWSLGFAISSVWAGHERKLQIVDESGEEVGTLNISGEAVAPDHNDAVLPQGVTYVSVPKHGWTTAFFPLTDARLLIQKPGIYYLRVLTDDGPEVVGQIHFALVDPPPLTPERIAAIRSEPNAATAVQVEFGCRHCSTKSRAYAALDRSEQSEAEGWTWYQDLPDEFACECGSTNIDLMILRRNLHAILGHRRYESIELNFIPLYERSSIETVRSNFAKLLSSKPREELLQRFIDKNPILLHQFPSDRIFSKPPILTFFVADFAIVTPQKELVLIELEKTTTRLMKKDGGVAAPLTHAFDQVQDWLHVVDEHRLAMLDSLKIEREEVSAIRGVVIVGRDSGYDAHRLRKLKGVDRGRITLLTYDDLLFALDALIRRLDVL